MSASIAFPKPKDIRRVPEAVHKHRDGREVCNQDTREGRGEYRGRTLFMRDRQGGRCCLEGYAPMCRGWMREDEASFEHENGRGGGKRDDRVSLPDGSWINGAAHVLCNGWKASRYIAYNRSFQRG